MEEKELDIDLQSLERYLAAHLKEFKGPLTAKKFPDGQSNPTYLLTAASGRYVLRRKPFGALLKSAHAVDREYRVICALADTDVPVAEGLHLCADEQVIGAMFYVMSYVEGPIFWSPDLQSIPAAERSAYYGSIIQTLADIHQVDLSRVGLEHYGRAGNYFARQVSRWSKQYQASETESIPEMDQLIRWLEGHIPEDDGQIALIHGDYRLDNLIFSPSEPKVSAVLDWELSTLGHPIADLAYFCMCLRLPAQGLIPGLQGIDRASLGIPSEADIVAQYVSGVSERAPLDFSGWSFNLAFCFFRLAAIAQGVRKRALEGNASSQQAAKVGALVRPLAQQALDVIEQEVVVG